MKKLFSNPLFHLALVLFLVLGLEGYYSVGAQSVPTPGSQPPQGTFYPPLDTGSASQTKSGSLFVGDSNNNVGLLSAGALGFTANGVSQQATIQYDPGSGNLIVYNKQANGSYATSTPNSGWGYADGVLYHGSGVEIGSKTNANADLSIGGASATYPFDFLSTSTKTILLNGPYYAFFLGTNARFLQIQPIATQPPALTSSGSGGISGLFYSSSPNSTLGGCGSFGSCNNGTAGFVAGSNTSNGLWFDNKDESAHIAGTLTAGRISAVGKFSLPDHVVNQTLVTGGKYTWGVASSTCNFDYAYSVSGPIPIHHFNSDGVPYTKLGNQDYQCILQFPPGDKGGKCPDGYFMTGIRFSSDGGTVLECHTMFPD